MLWALTVAAAAHHRQWGEEAVVFNAATASTHLLEQDTALVFAALAGAQGAALDERQLLTALGEIDADAGQRQALRDILGSLQASGLAESRAS